MGKEEVILGIGTSSVSGRTHQRALIEIDENQINTVFKKEMNYTTLLVESVTELRKHLSSSLGGSATINNVAPEVNAAISASSETSNHDLYYIIKINYIDHVELLDGTLMKYEEAAQLMEEDTKAFYKAYGDSYVNSITYGKEFLAVVQIKTNSNNSKVDASADIKATNPLFTAKAKTEAGIEKLANYNIANIHIFTKGTKTSVSAVISDIKELKACISSFEKDGAEAKKSNAANNADENNDAANSPDNQSVPIESTSHPYTRVFTSKNASNLDDCIFITKNLLDKITHCFDRITLCLNRLSFEEGNTLAIKYGDIYHEQTVEMRKNLHGMQAFLQEQANQIQHKIFFTPEKLKRLERELDRVVNILSNHEQKIFEFAGRTLIATVKSTPHPKPGHKHRSSSYFKLEKMPNAKHLFFEVEPIDRANQNPEEKVSFDLKRRRHVIPNKVVFKDIETNTPKDMIKKPHDTKFYIANPKASSPFKVNIYAADGLPPLAYTARFSSNKHFTIPHPVFSKPSSPRNSTHSEQPRPSLNAAPAENMLSLTQDTFNEWEQNYSENDPEQYTEGYQSDVGEELDECEDRSFHCSQAEDKLSPENETPYDDTPDEIHESYDESIASAEGSDKEGEEKDERSETNVVKIRIA